MAFVSFRAIDGISGYRRFRFSKMACARFKVPVWGRFPWWRRHPLNAPFFANPSGNRNNISGDTPSPALEGRTPWCWIPGRDHAVTQIPAPKEVLDLVERYAWSAKLPLSVLTDFEEFAVYDCRIKPSSSACKSKDVQWLDVLELRTIPRRLDKTG
jgi:hypothetical protein